MNIYQFYQLGYTIKTELDDSGLYLTCTVYKIEYTSGHDEIPFYSMEYSNDHTDNLADAKWFCRGHIKWDRCSNWEFNNNSGLHHFCEQQELKNVGLIMSECFELAKIEIGSKFMKD